MNTHLLFAGLTAALFASSVYLLLSPSILRLVLGVFVLSNATHLLIFVAGRLTEGAPPLLHADRRDVVGVMADPVPQALILTAIVIGFALLVFLMVLAYRAYARFGTIDTDVLTAAEPEPGPALPGDEV
jgi:multicomponent Na+:H+ antiporter subunit C